MNSEYSFMREALESAESLMCDLFMSGLESLARHKDALYYEATALKAIGLLYGASLFESLAETGRQGKTDISWDGGSAVIGYARLWEYIKLCKSRLDYLEASNGEVIS